MAKLSARGREVLLKLKKTKISEYDSKEIHSTLAICDDGRILQKLSWKDYPGSWKQWKKLKKELKKGEKTTLEDFVNVIASLEKQGYVKV